MASMGDIEAEALAAVRRGEHRIEGLFHRAAHAAPETPAPGPVTLAAAPPKENPVTVFSEGKTLLHDALEKIESVDEAAVGVVEAIKVNPTAISITNTLASIAHLPDPQGLLSGVDGLLKSFAPLLAKGVADTAPAQGEQASFTPAGPAVGGQA